MHDNEEGLCKICESYKNYLQLQEEGYGKEESFHEAVSYMVCEMIEDLMGIGFEEGYSEGYKDSLRSVAKHSLNLADELEDDSCTCDEDFQCGVDCGCVKQCREDDILKFSNKEFLVGEEFVQWLKKRL